MGEWKRPTNVPFPMVYARFKGRKEINGAIPNFWIQDIPEEEFENVVHYMITEFTRDEPICTYSKMYEDPVSVKEFEEIWRDLLKHKVGLICYMENPNPNGKPILAGMNCTYIKCKNEKPLKLKGKSSTIIVDTLDYMSKMKDEFEELKGDVFLSAMGLYVLKDFRGQGLGLELLKAREPLCKALGLKATVTFFSAKVSQLLAARAGFQELSCLSYADLEKADPRLRYPGIEEHTTHARYMYKIYLP